MKFFLRWSWNNYYHISWTMICPLIFKQLFYVPTRQRLKCNLELRRKTFISALSSLLHNLYSIDCEPVFQNICVVGMYSQNCFLDTAAKSERIAFLQKNIRTQN
jgi:hypothetical protein